MSDSVNLHISGTVPPVAWCRDGRLFSNVAGHYVVIALPFGRIVGEGEGPVDKAVSYELRDGETGFEVETQA